MRAVVTSGLSQLRFICFVGIDGSGKTTLAYSVARALTERGIEFQYVHALMKGWFTRPLMIGARFLFARGKSWHTDYEAFASAKRRAASRWSAFYWLYRDLIFFDYGPQVFCKVFLPLAQGRRLVSDRYVYDTVINQELNSGFDLTRFKRTVDFFFRFFPAPDHVFWVDVPEEVAFSRKSDVPDIAYLRERRDLYRQVAQAFGMVTLNGELPLETLTRIVVESVLDNAYEVT